MISTDVNWHDIIGAGLIDACCMEAAIRCIVNRFHCLSSTVTGVLLTPTGAQGTRGDWAQTEQSQIAHRGWIGQS